MRHVGPYFIRPRHGVVRKPAFMIIYIVARVPSGAAAAVAIQRIRSHVLSEVYIQGRVVEAEAPPTR